ncbi:Six-hairpin glycosidase-like protein [Xylogone sp. PMI_703]|nr:Six-hairpin glycosidase-like protein [Xylogone sp. PMI_703]
MAMTQLQLHQAHKSPTTGTRFAQQLHEPLFSKATHTLHLHKGIENTLQQLFAENVAAKIWRVAQRDLENNNPPSAFPETVPQEGPSLGRYMLREAAFWTCGFFPGSLYTILERVILYPNAQNPPLPRESLLAMCRAWSEPLHAMVTRTDTHDLGFIVQPALRLDWELTSNRRSLESLITAAHSLATRYDATVGAIRSWDLINKKDMRILSKEDNFLIIIDSLCNLDLLFYASTQSKTDTVLATIARTHAHTLLHTHLRSVPRTSTVSRTGYSGPLYSTCHVVNIDPRTGMIKQHMTAQGYAAGSTWTRGQAWAILGYTQTYRWTKEHIFLDAACGLTEYFLQRLGAGYQVPLWDFDAPIDDPDNPVLDASAGAIAAYGMLLLSEVLLVEQQVALAEGFLVAAINVIEALLRDALAPEKARFVENNHPEGEPGKETAVLAVEDIDAGKTFDAILKNGTANNNAGANRKYWNHGLVYADYYLLQFGNQLLRMGLA